MKALHIIKDTAKPKLIFTQLPIPTPEPGHLLIKVRASGLNPSDAMNAVGGFPYTTFPRVPGRDYAGTIASIADSSSKFKVGQNVFGTSGRYFSFTQDGAHAEYTIISEAGASIKPDSLTFEQAATLGVPFTTAMICLDRARAVAGEHVLVLGAFGTVGKAVVQLAKARGCKVTGAARDPVADLNLLDDPDLTKHQNKFNVIVDTTGSIQLIKSALANGLAVRGRIAYIAAPRQGEPVLSFDMKALYRAEQEIVGCNSLNYSAEEMKSVVDRLAEMLEKNEIQPYDDLVTVPLEEKEVIEAYDAVAKRAGVKYVIVP